jgi:hypothetical protein
MPTKYDGTPGGRYKRRPRLALRETHPGFARTVFLLVAAGVVIYFGLHGLHVLH